MPAKTSRVRLSDDQKLALYSYHIHHTDISPCALITWAGSTFKVNKPPSSAAVLLLLKHPVTVNDARSNPNPKTTHPVHCPLLEKILVRWIERCEEHKMPIVTWETIRAKSERIRRVLVQDPSTLRTASY